MERRNFCKLLIAAGALPLAAKRGQPAEPVVEEFDRPVQSYAAFCALPENQRVFYALRGNRIVSERLDVKTWHPTGWGNPPALPIPGGSWDGVPMRSPIPGLAGNGPYKPTWESLLQYDCPDWYRDAKFGIWNYWCPQMVPEDGDWYARNMYIQGSKQNQYQVAHYGPPSRYGYKELCAQWTMLNWDPASLMARYKRAGAKFFLALANHHDGFDMWNSKHHPWNSVNLGPHRDIVGTWAETARQQGLRFGVTVHQHRNWWWFQPSHGADKTGLLAGVPYDGELTLVQGKGQWWEGYDPQQLYCVKHPFDALPDASFVKNFYDRTRDVIDQHQPDVLFFDNPLLPLGWGGMNIAAYYYNRSLELHAGKMEGVITIKKVPPRLYKAAVADIEGGIAGEILPYAWQSETSLGDWLYRLTDFTEHHYKHPGEVIHWLADTVSKNGTFILNIPGRPDGTLDSTEEGVLDAIGEWLARNGEAIYDTRPWKVFGEGAHWVKAGTYQGQTVSQLGAADIRFTQNKAGTIVYAMALGWPSEALEVKLLGTDSAAKPGKITNVQLLGTEGKLSWKQTPTALRVELPKAYHPKADYAAALKVTLE
jgi:alpha-L-fucosidase